jgi:sterol desaturase/sphingolipid hydroxylase (fatty acid hydroxylase superfamily)
MWSTTFQRFPAGKTSILGVTTVDVSDWSRPRSGESRIFEQDQRVLERLTCAHPAAPVALYAPLGLALLWWAVQRGATPLAVAGWYVAGVLGWSLVEYLMHRYSFHHVPTTRLQVAIGYLTHGVHHAYPDDARRWVLPLVVTIPVGAAIFGAGALVLGVASVPWFAGFMHGYLMYDTIHFAVHRGPLPTPVGRFLRRYHFQHHYATTDRRFGVSSPLWDIIFRTAR